MDYDDIAVIDDEKDDMPSPNGSRAEGRNSSRAGADTRATVDMPASLVSGAVLMRARSLSDGGVSTGHGQLTPPPHLAASSGFRACKDDSSIGSGTDAPPRTPRGQALRSRNMSLQLPQERAPERLEFSGPRREHRLQQTLQEEQQGQQDKQAKQGQESCEKQLQPPSTPISANSAVQRHKAQKQQQQRLHEQHQLQLKQEQQQQLLYLHQPTYIAKPVPLSPQLDPSQSYAAPIHMLPRRSRGLDFSRAATSLHHSTLADQSSPDSSPTTASGRVAMNIPGRKPGDLGAAPESSNSLWSMMGRSQDININRTHPSSSLGSVNNICSDSSSSSENDDFMDEDMDEPFVTTPQVGKVVTPVLPTAGGSGLGSLPWLPSSPAANGLASFQQRQRPRKQPKSRTHRLLGLGFGSSAIAGSGSGSASGSGSGSGGGGGGGGNGGGILSRSPPIGFPLGGDNNFAALHSIQHERRESISWAANQLHISGSESDDNMKSHVDGGVGSGGGGIPGRDTQRGVIRRAVTRRGNHLPKTKGFARIRAALLEESAPAEAEFRREAEVVRQVLESDVKPEAHVLTGAPLISPRLESPGLSDHTGEVAGDMADYMADDTMAMDGFSPAAGRGPSGGGGNSFRHRNGLGLKSRHHWESPALTSHAGAIEGGGSTRHYMAQTPPMRPRDASATSLGLIEDLSMESPLTCQSGRPQQSHQGQQMVIPNGGIFPMTTGSSSGGSTPQPGPPVIPGGSALGATSSSGLGLGSGSGPGVLPSAAEITRRINSKRRRDDDFDPASFKRRAVSPGMSVHNSPIMQSPLQRDMMPWGGATGSSSRPGSNSGSSDYKPLFFPPLSSLAGGISSIGNGSSGPSPGENRAGTGSGSSSGRIGKGRVGYQAMVDANDSITRLSIE